MFGNRLSQLTTGIASTHRFGRLTALQQVQIAQLDPYTHITKLRACGDHTATPVGFSTSTRPATKKGGNACPVNRHTQHKEASLVSTSHISNLIHHHHRLSPPPGFDMSATHPPPNSSYPFPSISSVLLLWQSTRQGISHHGAKGGQGKVHSAGAAIPQWYVYDTVPTR